MPAKKKSYIKIAKGREVALKNPMTIKGPALKRKKKLKAGAKVTVMGMVRPGLYQADAGNGFLIYVPEENIAG